MDWERPKNLGKTVEAVAINRPVKVAYLVPFEEQAESHLILDAVFYESYARWAGAHTLVIPTKSTGFLHPEYGPWIDRYDPDLVYSYVELESGFADTIDRLCCPIAILRHDAGRSDGRPVDWRTFLPHWHREILPISSISTVASPASIAQLPFRKRPAEPLVFTQHRSRPDDRFLADNFGTGVYLMQNTNPVAGLFGTLCLATADVPDNQMAATVRCASPEDAFRAIANREATPIARLAAVHSEGVARVESAEWAGTFRLFVGNSVLDRIHFWSARNLSGSRADTAHAMIVDPSTAQIPSFLPNLGHFLNQHNFKGHGSGPHQVELHSASVPATELRTYRDRLALHTHNALHVGDRHAAPVVPSERDLAERVWERSTDSTVLKLTEDATDIVAPPPSHVAFLLPQHRGHAHGQWMVDLRIDRHHNLSRYSNVIDSWMLPRRLDVAPAFTKRMAKPTKAGWLALVPSSPDFPLRRPELGLRMHYEIYLPSDQRFFEHLALRLYEHALYDTRSAVSRTRFTELAVSDKGQNLRGVISMFDDLNTAGGILTRRFWREVLEKANDRKASPRSLDWEALFGQFPNKAELIARLTKEYRYQDRKAMWRHLKAGFWDTLEHLVRAGVFAQVSQWRCRYCGHANSRSFDAMKLKSECDICSTSYLVPIDQPWRFELNSFVHRCLVGQAGLPVLWTIHHLQKSMHNGSFWYLPEVDLFAPQDGAQSKNEIDILCVRNGVFCAVEVKRSASLFLNVVGALDKFVHVMQLLRPDVAYLAFMQYVGEGRSETETDIKARLETALLDIRRRLGGWTRLEVIMAADDPEFSEYTGHFGISGSRSLKVAEDEDEKQAAGKA